MYQSSAHLALDIPQSYEYLRFNQLLSICSEVHKATISLPQCLLRSTRNTPAKAIRCLETTLSQLCPTPPRMMLSAEDPIPL